MTAEAYSPEREAHTRYSGVGLVVRLEHQRDGVRPQNRTMLTGTPGEEGGDVARHVQGCGVDRAGRRCHPLTVYDRLRTVRTNAVASGQPHCKPWRSQQIGIGHPEGLEDALSEIVVQRLPAYVFYDLAERGVPMVGVGPDCARFGGQPQAALVILRERGHSLVKREGF